jgi:hypothetical protein
MRLKLSMGLVLSGGLLFSGLFLSACKKDCTLPPCPAGGFDFMTCKCTGFDGSPPPPSDGSADDADAGTTNGSVD